MYSGTNYTTHTVTQFETRWNLLIVKLFGLGQESEPEHDDEADERAGT